MTHNVPASPPSKAKPEPDSAGYVTGIGAQQAVWYDVEHEIEPLYNAFSHDQRHVALLPVFPASSVPQTALVAALMLYVTLSDTPDASFRYSSTSALATKHKHNFRT